MTPTKEQIQQALMWINYLTKNAQSQIRDYPNNSEKLKDAVQHYATIRTVLQNAVAGQWQPIETAPASKEVLVLIGIDIFSAYQNTLGQLVSQDPSGGGQCFLYSKPTHWMPLPAPPAQPTTGDGE